jgi:SAM-dependent methyltransferase
MEENLTYPDLDWQHWFARWEAMQNCYVPHRLYRFDLMLRLADLPREDEVHILDLGCGPGTLSLRALRHYPNARLVAADFDPVMLAIGQEVAGEAASCIQFLRVDLRQADWWQPYQETFDLIVSSTALHWLSEEHMRDVYEHSHRALKPGGRFFNSDHMASNDPDVQTHYRKLLHVNQQSAFHVVGADDWEAFWRELEQAMGQKLDRSEEELWEGTDNGLPRQFHVETLRACGFEQVAFHWQDLGEAVIGARKPSSA